MMIKGEGTGPAKGNSPLPLCEGGDVKLKQLAIRDVIDLLSGKWKIQLIGVLSFSGSMRFTELLRAVDGIAAKMLSKELQSLEANKLVKRTVMSTRPLTVEYEITEYGQTLHGIIYEMVEWGLKHREKIMREA